MNLNFYHINYSGVICSHFDRTTINKDLFFKNNRNIFSNIILPKFRYISIVFPLINRKMKKKQTKEGRVWYSLENATVSSPNYSTIKMGN